MVNAAGGQRLVADALLVHGRKSFTKLLVGCGLPQRPLAAGNVGAMVTARMIEACAASPRDIHDSSSVDNRSRSRDAKGRNRFDGLKIGFSHSPEVDGTNMRLVDRKSKVTWDTAPFRDFNGRYCDRLLLGSPPTRAAVIEPRGTVCVSVGPLLQQFHALDYVDVLIVSCSAGVPLGAGVLTTARAAASRSLVDHTNKALLSSATDCIRHRFDLDDGSEVPVLFVGLGSAIDHLAPVPAPVAPFFRHFVARKMAFAAAYWCSQPARARQYLEKDFVWEHAAGGPSLRDPAAMARLAGGEARVSDADWQLWSSLMRPMLSTGDFAVLDAFVTGATRLGAMDRASIESHAARIAESYK